MESVAMPVQALGEANRKLEQLLQALHPTRQSLSITPEHLAAALTELLRVGEWLHGGLTRRAEGQLAQELVRYRKHLLQLKELLPGVHAQLLTERSRLEAERTHLEAAASWAKSAGRSG